MIDVHDGDAGPTFGHLLARSEAVVGDQLRARLHWESGDLSALVGQTVSLRITAQNASLYSFWVAPLFTTFISGDFNGDGIVDQADLDLVLLNWGGETASPPGGWLALDQLVGDVIDQSELDLVLLNWGSAAAATSGTLTATPEPSSFVSLALGVVFLLARRRRPRTA